MTVLEEGLLRLNEEEIFGNINTTNIEGSEIIQGMAKIQSIVQEVIENMIDRGTILTEDLNFLTNKQKECIKNLGDILDKVNTY
jgi:hypothetical protein